MSRQRPAALPPWRHASNPHRDHFPELAAGQRHVGLVVLKQHIDTTTPTGRLVFHVLGAIDEFQRELIVEGTREGLDAARARGRTGGRKPKLNARQAATVRRTYEAVGPDGKRQQTPGSTARGLLLGSAEIGTKWGGYAASATGSGVSCWVHPNPTHQAGPA